MHVIKRSTEHMFAGAIRDDVSQTTLSQGKTSSLLTSSTGNHWPRYYAYDTAIHAVELLHNKVRLAGGEN
jgi:hypothetical protein